MFFIRTNIRLWKAKNMLITRQGFVKHIEVSRKKEDKYT